MEEETQYYILETSPPQTYTTTPAVKYIVEGSSVPKSFQRATSMLSGKTVTQLNQITTGNTGEDPSRGVGYAAGVTFGRNVLGDTSIVPRLIVMPEDDPEQVNVAGEVDLDTEALQGQSALQTIESDITQEEVNIIVLSQNEEDESNTEFISEDLSYQFNKENETELVPQNSSKLEKALNNFPPAKKSKEKRRSFDPSMKPHQCRVCENRSYTARKDLYRHIRKEHPTDAQEMINEIRREWKESRRRRRAALPEESEHFTVDCMECGRAAEPSQRDKYLCRCLTCDLMFRVSAEVQEAIDATDEDSKSATVLKREITLLTSEEVAKTDATWWEEGSQVEFVSQGEDNLSDVESLMEMEETDAQQGEPVGEVADTSETDVMENAENEEDGVKCDRCMEHFTTSSLLKVHLNSPHRCDFCCKKFSSQLRLLRHMRFHGKAGKKLQQQITEEAKQSEKVEPIKKPSPTRNIETVVKPSSSKAPNSSSSPSKEIKQSAAVAEVGVRRSSRANKGVNRRYDEPVIKLENIDEEREDLDDVYEPEATEDADDDDAQESNAEEEEMETELKNDDGNEDENKAEDSPVKKKRRGFFGRRRSKHFPCSECDKVLTSVQGLRNHLRGHTGYKKRYQPPPVTECTICSAKITSFQGYQNHMRIHKFGEDSYACGICDKRFTDFEKFEEHQMLHDDVKYSGNMLEPGSDYPFRCKLCVHKLYKYKERSQLYRHFRVRHPASAAELMEDEMKIRRISKAMKVIKEKESKEKPQNSQLPEALEPISIIVTLPTNEDGETSESIMEVDENTLRENIEEETHVLIDISDILACAENVCAENGSAEVILDTVARGDEVESKIKETMHESSEDENDEMTVHKCINCREKFADQESLCRHAIKCSEQVQKYVEHMEKRRKETKRYFAKRSELSCDRKVEFTCGSCGEKFKGRDKLGQHIMESHPDRTMNDCQVCGQDFLSKEELEDHIKIHPEYEQQQVLCPKCGKRFSNLATYQAHERKLCGPSEQCDQCGRIFKFATTLERHKIRAHGERDYYVDNNSTVLQEEQTRDKAVCPVCSDKFPDEAAVKVHLKSVHSHEEAEKPFSCPQCSRRFKRHKELIHHKLIHAGEKPYKCKVCNKGFRSISVLTQHKYRHTSTKNFKCSICDAQFAKLFALKAHLARHSTQINCPVCPRKFQSQEMFEEHFRIHTGERPVKCKYCGEGFTSTRYVNRHITVKHSDVEVTVRTTQYTCDVPDCTFSCTHASTLRYHKLRHTGEKPYQCDMCQKAFRSSSRLNEHKRMHTGLRPYKCQYCEDFFPNSTAVRRHERRHVQTNNFGQMAKRSISKGPHVCEWCSKVFIKKNDHTKHIRVHTGELPYQCKFCLRKFRTNSAWRRHEREHTGEAPKLVGDCMCNQCGKRVAKNQITAHMKLHGGENPFQCDFCDETFSSKQALSGHHRKAHGKEKTVYQCTLCCEHFKDHTKWKHHMMLHTGEKPEKCDVCGKSFRLKKELKRHMLGHTDPQHICPYCKKAMRTPSQLKHHIRTHTGEKPHRCEECDRTFNQSYALKRHMMTHTDEKPHVCEECDSSYKTLDALQRHQKKKHGFVSATKRFPCPLCDREFLSAWHLDEHIKFHAGTRPHKCNYCERSFNSQLDLDSHVPLHTGQLKYECEECGRGFKTEVECAEHLSMHTEEVKNLQCRFCNQAFVTSVQLRRHVESHITVQDGQVYVVGSSQPNMVYEIVTEPEQTIVETTPMEEMFEN